MSDFIVSGGTGFAVDTDELARCSVVLASAVTGLDRAALSLTGLAAATKADAGRALIVNSAGAVAAQIGEPVLQPHITANLQQRYSRAVGLAALVEHRVEGLRAACAAVRETVESHRSGLNSAIHLYGGAESETLGRLAGFGGVVAFGTGMLTGSTPGWWRDPGAWGSFGTRLLGAPTGLLLYMGDGDGSAAAEKLIRGASPRVLGAGLLGLAGLFTSPLYQLTLIERAVTGYGPVFPIGFEGGKLTYHGQPIQLSEMTPEQVTAMVASVYGQELYSMKDSLMRGGAFIGGRAYDFATSELLPYGLGAAGGALGGAAGAALAGAVGAGAGGPVGGTAAGGVAAVAGRVIGGELGSRLGEHLDEPLDNLARRTAERRLADPSISDSERELMGFFLRGLEGDSYLGAGQAVPHGPGVHHAGDVSVASHGVVRIFGGEDAAVAQDLAGLVEDVGEVKGDVGNSDVGCVRIQTRYLPGGESAHVVLIPGTTNFLDNWTAQPHDIGSDLEGVAGLRSAQINEVVKAMDQAGIKPSEEVLLVGHSGGGIAAAEIAADPVLARRFNVGAVLSVGAPIGNSDIPEDVRVLSLENRADPVVSLDGRPLAPSENHVTISGTLNPPPGGWQDPRDTHLTPAYADFARAAASQGIVEYEDFARFARERFGVGDEGAAVRSQDFVAVRSSGVGRFGGVGGRW